MRAQRAPLKPDVREFAAVNGGATGTHPPELPRLVDQDEHNVEGVRQAN
jgi:hypothetical protein